MHPLKVSSPAAGRVEPSAGWDLLDVSKRMSMTTHNLIEDLSIGFSFNEQIRLILFFFFEQPVKTGLKKNQAAASSSRNKWINMTLDQVYTKTVLILDNI